MKNNRIIRMLWDNPLNIFKILRWNIHNLCLKLFGIKTIVYNIHMDYFYNTFEPIYLILKENKKIRIYFSYFKPNTNLYNYLAGIVSRKNIVSNLISPFIYYDLFITCEINGPDFPFSIMPTRTIQMYHGTGIYPFYEKQDILSRFNLHFAVGPQYNEFVNQLPHSGKYENTCLEIGYPKLDSIVNPDAGSLKNLKNMYGISDQFVILYTPHWNQWGSLHNLGLDMIQSLSKLDNVLILIKVHNFLFVRYKEDNWEKQLEEISNTHSNVVYVKRPNTQEIYPLGDMLITDTGTTSALEFSLTNKPLFVYDNPQWFENNPHGEVEKDINETAVCFTSIEEITELSAKLIKKEKDMLSMIEQQKEKQQKLVSKYLYNPAHATPAAVKVILKELNLND